MIVTLEDFVLQFKKIKELGWVKTHRTGSTGIGKTLEDLLGIPENNLNEPDFGEYELKSCRIDSKSMLTIFTKSPEPNKSNTQLLAKYGYGSNHKILHSTLTTTKFTPIANTQKRLKIVFDRKNFYIASDTGKENIFWQKKTLCDTFNKKYKNKLVYVKAERRKRGASEEFYFVEAYKASGFDCNKMIALLERGKIFVDLRIGQYSNGKTHDHGTGFRIKAIDQHLLFKELKRIV